MFKSWISPLLIHILALLGGLGLGRQFFAFSATDFPLGYKLVPAD